MVLRRRCLKMWHCRWHILLIGLVLNILLLLYLAVMQHQDLPEGRQLRSQVVKMERQNFGFSSEQNLYGKFKYDRPVDEVLTIVIREFEEFDNEVEKTVKEIRRMWRTVKIVIISDGEPYPPFTFIGMDGVTLVSLEIHPLSNISQSRPDLFIRTDFVLFLIDSIQFSNPEDISSAITFLANNHDVKALALSSSSSPLECHSAQVSLKEWTLKYFGIKSSSSKGCDFVQGEHSLLVRKDDLIQLANPYLKPISLSFYIQAVLRKWKTFVFDKVKLSLIRNLYQEPHIRWKHKRNEEQRKRSMFAHLGIKQVVHNGGRTEWYGCSKGTARCFGTVLNDMPSYLYKSRWTPPCCLKALRETAKYVFRILDKCDARYWLEGGSLLGAARHGDIIPWDYDVDIGIYQDDLSKCEDLNESIKKAFVDEKGFVWERASEGEFFRVQYSETNHIHVDIFPFFSRNGTMTKNTWLKTHRQDTEFPERFLKPLTRMKFAGTEAFAPNHVKEFLEYKFGAGVIEHPKYPNAVEPSL